MTTTRYKSFLLLTTTLLIGVVIGMLLSGYWTRKQIADMRNSIEKETRFVERMGEHLKADPATMEQIRPILETHFEKVQADHQEFRQSMREERLDLVDSLRPYLNASQLQRLEEMRFKKPRRPHKRRRPKDGPPPYEKGDFPPHEEER
ncbi:MAG: hypothetical protein AAF399_12370 [Bacteroidota bacterium]